MTDYSNRNIVVEKEHNSIMVVVMALDDSNRIAVAAEDFDANNLFKCVHLFDFLRGVWVIWYRQDFYFTLS